VVGSSYLAHIMGEMDMERGLKKRNPLARNVRLLGKRIKPSKKGKGSYKRKGRFNHRPFSICALQQVVSSIFHS